VSIKPLPLVKNVSFRNERSIRIERKSIANRLFTFFFKLAKRFEQEIENMHDNGNMIVWIRRRVLSLPLRQDEPGGNRNLITKIHACQTQHWVKR
jgi:hypothetical protein